MIMESLGGVCERASPHTSPSKRSFDVAFLTGRVEVESRPPSEGPATAPPNKLSRSDDDAHAARKVPSAGSASPVRLSVEGDARPSAPVSAPGSAFTKVTRASRGASGSPPAGAAHLSSALDALGGAWAPAAASASFSGAVSSLLGSSKLAPLLAAPGLLPPALAPFLPPDHLNNNLVEEYLKSHHQHQQHQLEAKMAAAATTSPSGGGGSGGGSSDLTASEALSRLRSSMYPPSGDPYKLAFPSLPPLPLPQGDSPKLGSAPPPYLPPQTSISSLMPPTLSALALSTQNVCAKCNISFRMTSDLVYHMRSQHKREPDPYKKRRNEKLKCSFCGETFRERHHLTRHMSAHQDREEEEEPK